MIVSGNTIFAETAKAADWPPFELPVLSPEFPPLLQAGPSDDPINVSWNNTEQRGNGEIKGSHDKFG